MNCDNCKKKIQWYQKKANYLKYDGYFYWLEWYHRSCLPKVGKKKKDDKDDTSNNDFIYSS